MSTSSALRRDKKKASGLVPIDVDALARRSLKSRKVKEAKEHRLGVHGLKMDALERHGRVKVLETATVRRVELIAYTSLKDVAEHTETCCTVEGAAGSFILFVATLHSCTTM